MKAERALNIIIIALELITSYISLSLSSMFRGIHDGLSILFLVIGVICAGCVGYMCYLLVKKNKGEKLIMKRYKLLKDLPTFKAGEEFCLSDKGALVFADKHSIVAYSKKTLREFPNILRDWFEEIEENEEYKRWRAKEGRDYWFIDSFGYASENKDYRTLVSNHYYKIGNHFKTEAEAEKYGEYLIALQTIKDDAKGFKPDWKNDEEVKYYGRLNWNKNAFLYNTCYDIQFQGTIYFKSKEDIEESFKKHRKEWLIVLGVEE